MTTLLRTSLGIHASRIALAIESGEKSPRPEWQESLFLALAHGHPGLAASPVDRGVLLAMHRQAWNIAGLNKTIPGRNSSRSSTRWSARRWQAKPAFR